MTYEAKNIIFSCNTCERMSGMYMEPESYVQSPCLHDRLFKVDEPPLYTNIMVLPMNILNTFCCPNPRDNDN